MDSIQYILTAGICLAISYMVFRILFKNGTDFSRQRLFIISSVVLSLVLPLSRFSLALLDFRETTVDIPFSGISGSEGLSYSTLQSDEPGFLSSIVGYLPEVYLIITSVLILLLLSQLIRILFLYSISVRVRTGSLIVLSNSRIQTPFSFFNLVFIPEALTDSAERESIIIHESIHSSQYHSFDNLLIELLAAVMWFNPFVWMIRRSMHLVHEYLADEGTLGAGIDRIRYQALLINQVAEEKLICLSSDFNNKLLKKRMIMMTNFKQKKEGIGRISVIFPLTLLMFMVVSVLNGFFAPEIKASDPGGFTILKPESIVVNEPLVQKDTSAKAKIRVRRTTEASKMDDVKVVGYGKSPSKMNDVVVVGYGESKDSSAESPVYVVDGVYKKNIDDLDPGEISSVDVHKADNLIIVRTKSYTGNKAASEPGVVIRSRSNSSVPENTLYIIDGEKRDKEALQSLDPSKIDNITVLKDKESMRIYTKEDYDGVIIINTKK